MNFMMMMMMIVLHCIIVYNLKLIVRCISHILQYTALTKLFLNKNQTKLLYFYFMVIIIAITIIIITIIIIKIIITIIISSKNSNHKYFNYMNESSLYSQEDDKNEYY